MTAAAWTLVALAVLLTVAPRAAPVRVVALSARGRLAGVRPSGGGRARSRRAVGGRVPAVVVVVVTVPATGSTIRPLRIASVPMPLMPSPRRRGADG